MIIVIIVIIVIIIIIIIIKISITSIQFCSSFLPVSTAEAQRGFSYRDNPLTSECRRA